MNDSEHLEMARQDPTWREITASFAIEGMALSERDEIIVGRMIAGEIDFADVVATVGADAGASTLLRKADDLQTCDGQ